MAIVSSAGIAEVLRLGQGEQSKLDVAATEADAELRAWVGDANYSAVEDEDDDVLSVAAMQLVIGAGKLLGAAAWYAGAHMPTGSRGVVATIRTGEERTETMAAPDDVARIVVRLRKEALRKVVLAGAYQRPATGVGLKIEVGDET